MFWYRDYEYRCQPCRPGGDELLLRVGDCVVCERTRRQSGSDKSVRAIPPPVWKPGCAVGGPEHKVWYDDAEVVWV